MSEKDPDISRATRHKLWFGTSRVRPDGIERRHGRCSCGWSAPGPTFGLLGMVAQWLEHVEWALVPGCSIVAEVDDVLRASFTETTT